MADSCWCMAKSIQYCKVKQTNKQKKKKQLYIIYKKKRKEKRNGSGRRNRQTMLQKLLSIQHGFLKQRGRLKGLLIHGEERGSRLSFVAVIITKLSGFLFFLFCRPEKRKLKLCYKIVVYFNKMLNITKGTSEPEVDGVQESHILFRY